MESLDWKKSIKATINPRNKGDCKYFQHTEKVTLIYKNWNKVDPYLNKFYWEGIDYSSRVTD